MNDLNMNSVNEALIGKDYDTTVMAYYVRDQTMNIDPTDHITKCLIKLRYYNIDSAKDFKRFYVNSIHRILTNSPNLNEYIHMTIADLILSIKDTPENAIIENNINYRIQRATMLSKFLSLQTDTLAFYKALTLDELEHIGY
jgi:hypothetical protein